MKMETVLGKEYSILFICQLGHKIDWPQNRNESISHTKLEIEYESVREKERVNYRDELKMKIAEELFPHLRDKKKPIEYSQIIIP